MNVLLSCGGYFGEQVLRLIVEEGHSVILVRADIGGRPWNAAASLGISATPQTGTVLCSDIPGGTDIIMCAQSYEYVTDEARAASRYGAIGYHPSLLPDLKGKNAIGNAIKSGRSETGGSMYVLSSGWDDGAVICSEAVDILNGETASELWRRSLQGVGLSLYRRVLIDLKNGVIPWG